MSHRAPVLALLLAGLVVVLAACDDGGDGDPAAAVEGQLESQDRAQTALRQRIEELEGRVEAALVADDGTEAEALTDLDERLAALETGFEALSTRIDGAVGGQAELESEVQGLRETLTGVQSTLSELSDQIALLREDLDSLRQQFNSHRQHN